MFDNFNLTGKKVADNRTKTAPKQKCPKSNMAIADACIKLGERIADVKLYPYQIAFAKRMVESLLLEDAETITALFARQCVDPEQFVQTFAAPIKMKNLEKDQNIGDNDKGFYNFKTKVTDKWESKVTSIYEVFNHQKQSIILSDMHRVRLGSGKWGYIKDGSLNEKEDVSFMLKHISDDAPSSTPQQHSLYAIFASQLLLHGKKMPMVLDKKFRLSMHIHPSWVNEFKGATGYQDLLFNSDFHIKSVPIDDTTLNKIIQFAFINRKATLTYLLKQSKVEEYRNNRKKTYRIVINTGSTDVYREYLIQFLKEMGIFPTFKDEDTLVINDFESLLLCFQFLDEPSHFYYQHLRDYLDQYYIRTGYKIDPSFLFRIFKEFPSLKTLIKSSLFHHYRTEGMLLGTLIQLFMRKGISYSDFHFVLPNLYISPVKDIKQLPRSYEVFYDMETSSTFNVISGFVTHNSGKTEAISVVCDAIMVLFPYMSSIYPDDQRFTKFKHGCWIGIFAPSLDQSKTTFDRMRSRISSNNGQAILKEFGLKFETNRGDTIQLSNGSFTRCMTASEGSHIESKTFHMAVCEESQDISPFKLKKSIQPMLSSTAGTLVMIGTANTTRNHLLDMTEHNKSRAKEDGAKQNHFQVDYLEACKFNPKYAKHITREIERLGGIDTDEFKMSYRNIFCLERGMAFDPRQLEMYHPIDNPHGCFRDYDIVQYYHGKQTVCVGIDIGKSQDSTVITAVEVDFDTPIETHNYIAFHKKLIGWLEIVGDDFNAQFFQIYEFLERMQAQIVYMDTTGKGDVIYDRVSAAMPGIDILPYVFSRPSKSKLYKSFLHDVSSNRLYLPGGKNTIITKEYSKFYQQMSELEKEYHGEYLDCHKPEKKSRGDLPHDDYCVVEGSLISVICSQDSRAKLKRIEDVEIGDLVLTHKNRWKPVTKKYKRRAPKDDVIHITIKGQGILKITKNHPLLMKDGSFVPAEQVSVGDFLSLAYPRAHEAGAISFRQESYFALLGYFLMCGHLRAGRVVSFMLPEKPDKSFREDLEFHLKQGGGSTLIVTDSGKTYNCSISSKLLVDRVSADFAGITERFKRTVPKCILEGSSEAIKIFLYAIMHTSALFENEGIVVTFENKSTAYQVRDLLLTLGIPSYIKAPIYRNDIKLPSEVQAKQDFYTVSIEDKEFILKAIQMFDLPTRKQYNNIFTDFDLYHHLDLENCAFSSMVSHISQGIYKEDPFVYNLEVDEDHSYTLTKTTVHNCDSLALACWASRQQPIYNVQEVDSPFHETGRNKFLNL